jgi:hypothetical protein
MACARAACDAASPAATLTPVAKAITLGRLAMNFGTFVGLATLDARQAAVLAVNCGSCWAPMAIFLFARLTANDKPRASSPLTPFVL